LAIIIPVLIFLPLNKNILGIILALFITLIVGFWDDLQDISPKIRLVANLLSALIVVGSGIGIAYVSSPFGGTLDLSFFRIYFDFFGPRSIWLLPDLLAIIWIVWCMNITGWSAGVDGQLPGFVGISALFIGILGLKFAQDVNQWPVIIFSGALAGAYFGFLPYNFSPQSIMPGYSGKSIAGFSLAVLAILSGAKFATVFLLLAIPMLDATFVLLRRFIQRRSLIRPDGMHFHHLLLKQGWSRQKIAVFYSMVSLLLGLLSLLLNTTQKIIALCLVFIFFGLSVFKIYPRT
jgi:UDP-GlcNAc:undecaprenyl-phosphate GlcNAc-1-phosphate transferase